MFRSVCFVACLLSALPLHAEEPATPEARHKHAVIDIKKVDSDFAYQGEYVGKVDGERTGLQVIAFGAGKFEALVLAGGLPGAGWNGENQWRMTGQRNGDELMFSRNSYVGDEETKTETTLTYQVAGKTVNVQSADGRSQGSLKKTKRTSPTIGAAPPATQPPKAVAPQQAAAPPQAAAVPPQPVAPTAAPPKSNRRQPPGLEDKAASAAAQTNAELP